MFDRPQHPAAHGVLRMILEMNGEEILRADPVWLFRRSLITLGLFLPSYSFCPTAHWSSSPWNRKTHRIQDIYSGVTLL